MQGLAGGRRSLTLSASWLLGTVSAYIPHHNVLLQHKSTVTGQMTTNHDLCDSKLSRSSSKLSSQALSWSDVHRYKTTNTAIAHCELSKEEEKEHWKVAERINRHSWAERVAQWWRTYCLPCGRSWAHSLLPRVI